MVVVLWYPAGVESPTAVGGFTGARLLAGGCGIMWELISAAVGGFAGAERLAVGCGISSRNCNSWWIHRCWTVSWWLWHHVGVESTTAVGGFTGAGLLAGGCGNSGRNCNSWWIHRCWAVSWWLWHQQSELQKLVDLPVLDC